MNKIDCDDVGPLKDYNRNKIDIEYKKCTMQLTQPVLIRSFKDEFDLKNTEKCLNTPALPGMVLQEGKRKDNLSDKD